MQCCYCSVSWVILPNQTRLICSVTGFSSWFIVYVFCMPDANYWLVIYAMPSAFGDSVYSSSFWTLQKSYMFYFGNKKMNCIYCFISLLAVYLMVRNLTKFSCFYRKYINKSFPFVHIQTKWGSYSQFILIDQ